jgi:hypothetical protein
MSDLKRYNSFQQLKRSAIPNKLNAEQSKKAHDAFTQFFYDLSKLKKRKNQPKATGNAK